jgi:hypothetical protein
LASRSARTVDAWVTVTSSSTPSAPITIPARSSPESDRFAPPSSRKVASSLEKPVRCVRLVKSTASPAVKNRLPQVPRIAARLLVRTP